MENTTPILLYDIDGTLLRVKRDFLYALISEQLDAHKVDKPSGKIRSFAGRTDRGIFMELIGDRPDADDLFLKLRKGYCSAILENLKPGHIDGFEDALESARCASHLGIPVGLCTGNFREVAMKKVETAGLRNLFRFGGFGGGHEDRNFLPGEADRDYRSQFDDEPPSHRYVIIGDTPHDITCAKYFGALSVAVTTGGYETDELAPFKPDLILNSLKNPSSWLRKLGFDRL